MPATPLTPAQVATRLVRLQLRRVVEESQQRLGQMYIGLGAVDSEARTKTEAQQTALVTGRAAIVASLGDNGEEILKAFEQAHINLVAALSG